MQKLYAVVRRDHAPGLRASMAAHAFRRFASMFPLDEARWHRESNTIVILEAVDADALAALAERAARSPDVLVAPYVEPGLGLASIALLGDGAHRLLSSLPLALKAA